MEQNSFKIKQKLPQFVSTAAQILRSHGYEAYLVGGSVRDILLGKTPQDYDIATNAYPEEIGKIFPKSIPTGAQFGTMLVLLPDETGETHELEITTYRSEADYFGGRWPAKVEFTKTIEEDLARRDFTINAIALRLDDTNLETEDIVDPYNGLADLQAKTIRAVGNPVERFSEDGLRSLRACRLAANLGFTIEASTFAAISQTLHVTKHVSFERVRDELMKLLLKSPQPSVGLELMRNSGLLQLLIPELLEGIAVHQPQFHVDDVYTHTLKAVDIADDEVKLAALFHDIGKPRTRSEDEKGVHFYGHDQVGAEMTREIMQRLRFSKSEIERTAQLVRWHMFYYPNADWRKQQQDQLVANAIPDAQLTLLIIRHAQSTANVAQLVPNSQDNHLTELGKQQAQALANELQAKQIVKLISSPIERALDTAQIIGQVLGLEVNLDARFQERNFGELAGLSWEEFTRRFPKDDPSHDDYNYLPGAESRPAVISRVKIGLFTHIKENLGRTVAIVTHQGIAKLIQQILTEYEYQTKPQVDPLRLNNCEYIEYTIPLSALDPNFLTDRELEIVSQQQQEAQGPNAGGWSDAAVRRFIRNVGSQELIDDLMKLRIADATANPKSAFNPSELAVLAERIAKVRAQDMAMKVTDLELNGNDLLEQGFKGQEIGRTLHHLLELVTDDPLLNEKSKLLELALEYKSKL